ncbi:hypothetical protein B0H14DRAFT_3450727 [Mycena olivaceomarginata]|nr:hypothetical protein B0H14DRAFT_3450727 [Mycena olivaceomarginata]
MPPRARKNTRPESPEVLPQTPRQTRNRRAPRAADKTPSPPQTPPPPRRRRRQPAPKPSPMLCPPLMHVVNLVPQLPTAKLPNRAPLMFLTMILQLRLVLSPMQMFISKKIPPTAANSFRRRLLRRVTISHPPQCVVGIADRRGLALMRLRPVPQFDKQGEEVKECLICQQKHAADPRSRKKTFSKTTSTGVLRKHLYEHHLDVWVAG